MKLRLSTPDDLQTIMAIVADAQRALAALNIDQWQDGYPTLEIFQQDIENGNSYVLENEGNIIATATLVFNFEPTYDHICGAWLTYGDFAVIHRLATSPNSKRKGAAAFIFGEMEKICQQNHISSIKIDTHAGNVPMLNLLQKLGYTFCGIIYLESGKARHAFEKIVN